MLLLRSQLVEWELETSFYLASKRSKSWKRLGSKKVDDRWGESAAPTFALNAWTIGFLKL